MITILGPTASGKTKLAAAVAANTGGEIISADSRQVYKGMNIGTGKDLDEFVVDGKNIPYHLIDIRDAGYEYNIYEYQTDFYRAYEEILSRKATPILCGGTGMYIESILKGYKLIHVPVNQGLREKLEKIPHEILVDQLSKKITLHNTTDTSTKRRTIRALEIAEYYEISQIQELSLPKIDNIIFGIYWERSELKERITSRLKKRFNESMIDEVGHLIKSGISPEKLKFYGLEYKFIVQHINGDLSYNDMYQKLNVAIHQFAKRQMTWFKKMEKNGFDIHWIDGSKTLDEKLEIINSQIDKKNEI